MVILICPAIIQAKKKRFFNRKSNCWAYGVGLCFRLCAFRLKCIRIDMQIKFILNFCMLHEKTSIKMSFQRNITA